MQTAVQKTQEALCGLGYTSKVSYQNWHNILSEALLMNCNPFINMLTDAIFQQIRKHNSSYSASRGVVASSLNSEKTRAGQYNTLIKIGRWLNLMHPEIVSPKQWTRELVAEFVAMVDHLLIGDYMHHNTHHIPKAKVGKPITNNSKVAHISIMRGFIRDCQEWGWITRHFNPIRFLPITKQMTSQRKASPRIIADDVWAKLVWAGINLTSNDLPTCSFRIGDGIRKKETPWYPIAMVRAVVAVWLFEGLRSNEILRLRTHCIRWQQNNTLESAENAKICLLDVPVNKTGAAFTKPVDRYVGKAIAA